jgi:hypothetical protein
VNTNIRFGNILLISSWNKKYFIKNIVEELKTQILCSVPFFENLIDYEKMWKKYCSTGHAAVDNMILRIACWITKATNTHSVHIILIDFSNATLVERRRGNVTF